MARVTVFIPDHVLHAAEKRYLETATPGTVSVNRSAVVTFGLIQYADPTGRPEASERGRLETLRALRAAREALSEVEATLTQARPVQRRVRRYRSRST